MASPEEEMNGAAPAEGKGKGKGKFKGKGKGMKGGKGEKGKGKGFAKGKGKGKGGGEQMQVQERVVYQRQSRNAGQHTIEIYYPQFWFSQFEQEEFDARPDRFGPSVIGKYTKGVGQLEARFPSDDEDLNSFAMTAIHRLLERMEEKGINETGTYQPDGVALPIWNSIGRIDCGTESIMDRSKSVKSFCMDMFERYGNESNIEGVDQYNACYGGQACGLCTLSWVESDRWDGRYGIAVATDISDAHPAFMAYVGAACTATLFFPDAPLPHHSLRASCIMHRFDFCKPVGWHDMGPVTDGKYSVECYLDALDAAYANLRKKLNGREILAMTDYNVFHTGGGYHIVKKAFERLLRNERPDCRGAEKDLVRQTKLEPSVSILKIIGPCHTVSSFLNTGAVIMNTMEKALGKVMCVFTYGSGCASSMYQMRIDDVAHFDPLPLWKLQFYRNSIHVHPEQGGQIHFYFVETWMKFEYIPHGRKEQKIPVHKLEKDVYYLMEIDQFGRRYYHRGGLSTGPIENKYKLAADRAEGRRMRKHYGPVPEREEEEEASEEKEQSVEELWKEIEYEMMFDAEADENEELGVYDDRYLAGQKHTFIKPREGRRQLAVGEPDGLQHSYQIVGSWSKREQQDMERMPDGSFTFQVTLGENRWEDFYLIQDGNTAKKIYPFEAKSSKKVPTVGPHSGGEGLSWLLDGRDRINVPEEDVGMPGDKYLVTFRWKKLKDLSWEKLEGSKGDFEPGEYFIAGSFSDWENVQIAPDKSMKQGWYSAELQMTSLGLDFLIVRNEDFGQTIHPISDKPASMEVAVGGPDDARGAPWKVQGELGAVFKVSFYRDPTDCEPTAMKVAWTQVGKRPVQEPEPNYYIIGVHNNWGEAGFTKMFNAGGRTWKGDVVTQDMEFDPVNNPGKVKAMMPFRILMHKLVERTIHPDKAEATQLMGHKVLMDARGEDLAWFIGKSPADKAMPGSVFEVKLEVKDGGDMLVSWTKKA